MCLYGLLLLLTLDSRSGHPVIRVPSRPQRVRRDNAGTQPLLGRFLLLIYNSSTEHRVVQRHTSKNPIETSVRPDVSAPQNPDGPDTIKDVMIVLGKINEKTIWTKDRWRILESYNIRRSRWSYRKQQNKKRRIRRLEERYYWGTLQGGNRDSKRLRECDLKQRWSDRIDFRMNSAENAGKMSIDMKKLMNFAAMDLAEKEKNNDGVFVWSLMYRKRGRRRRFVINLFDWFVCWISYFIVGFIW